METLIVGGDLQRTKGSSKLHDAFGRDMGLPGTLRLPLLDKCEMVGVVDALQCIDLYGARGFSRIDAVSKNQLPRLRRKIERNFHIGDDIDGPRSDGLRNVLRERGADVPE